MITASIKYWLASTLILGLAYPLAMTGLGQAFFHEEVNGLLVRDASQNVRGSFLIAQKFESPKYFWPRPSGADYNAASSSGTNQSLSRKDLRDAIDSRLKAGAIADGLFSSGSGLDPEISPENAFSQADRIAKARNLKDGDVRELIVKNIAERDWNLFGEKRVNVMKLNLSLDRGEYR